MILVGQWTVVESVSLLIPQNTVAALNLSPDLGRLNLRIKFEGESTDKGHLGLEVNVAADGFGEITFRNWTNVLGTSMNEPASIGRSAAGQKILFLAAHWKIGLLNKLDLQILAE